MELLFLVYVLLGYWAAGVVFYENKIVVHQFGQLFAQKLAYGIFLGIGLIPLAILKRIFFRR